MPQTTGPTDWPKHLPLREFCRRHGIKPDAVRQRIRRAQWVEGREYHRDPLGHIHVSLKGYDRWVSQ